MASDHSFRQTGSERRFSLLRAKSEVAVQPKGFELSRTEMFLDGDIDIFDILAFQDKANREG